MGWLRVRAKPVYGGLYLPVRPKNQCYLFVKLRAFYSSSLNPCPFSDLEIFLKALLRMVFFLSIIFNKMVCFSDPTPRVWESLWVVVGWRVAADTKSLDQL